MGDRENFAPPDHLLRRSQKLWSEIVPRRARSPERLALLLVGLEALDRANTVKEILEAEGLTTKMKTTGAVHAHPLLKIEREGVQVFIKCWSQLGLGWDHSLDGRIEKWGIERGELGG